MDLDLFEGFFESEKRQRKLKTVTMIMFIALALEKLLSSVEAGFAGGRFTIYSDIDFLDIICINIYFATALLIGLKVRYDRLVIPDFFLLGVKLCIIATDVIFLIVCPGASLIEKFSAGEHIIEASLFAAFLICMFVGELSHGKRLPNFAHVCMNLLMICYPVTVLLEIGKLLIAERIHENHYITMFHFVRDVVGETFLDVPYFLLILMVSLTKHNYSEKAA